MGNLPSSSFDEETRKRIASRNRSFSTSSGDGQLSMLSFDPDVPPPPPYSPDPKPLTSLAPTDTDNIASPIYSESARSRNPHRHGTSRVERPCVISPGVRSGSGGLLSPDDIRYSRYYYEASYPRRSRSVSSNGPSSTNNNPASSSRSRKPLENRFELLRKFDTVIIVDDSTSMRGHLWKQTRDALAGIAAAAAEYDTDGIDIYFLNSTKVGRNLKSPEAVQRLFKQVVPSGLTLTGEKLEERLLDYFHKLDTYKQDPDNNPKPKRINFVVLTDGVPTDEPEDVIVVAARRLDAGHYPLSQVGIQFVQIGKDKRATKTLQDLDEALSVRHKIRDMVDTTPYNGKELTTESLGKILLGGINRKIDKEGFKCED